MNGTYFDAGAAIDKIKNLNLAIKTVWECFQATFLMLGQFGFAMLVYGAQRT